MKNKRKNFIISFLPKEIQKECYLDTDLWTGGYVYPNIILKYKNKSLLTAYSSLVYFKNHSFQALNDKEKEILKKACFDSSYLRDTFKQYIIMKHEESAKNNDIYFRVLTLLDRRTGKRTLKKFIENGDFYNAISLKLYDLVKIYKFRFELENIHYDEALVYFLENLI